MIVTATPFCSWTRRGGVAVVVVDVAADVAVEIVAAAWLIGS